MGQAKFGRQAPNSTQRFRGNQSVHYNDQLARTRHGLRGMLITPNL